MSQFWFFMRPQTTFSLLEEAARKAGLVMVFRRRPTKEQEIDLRVVVPGEDLAGLYASGGYSEVYLTLQEHPSHARDRNFPSKHEEALIMSGGRLAGNTLEQWTLRKLAKKSKVTSLFSALRRAIVARCEHGMKMQGSTHRYDDMHWERDLANLQMCLRLELADDREFLPDAPK